MALGSGPALPDDQPRESTAEFDALEAIAPEVWLLSKALRTMNAGGVHGRPLRLVRLRLRKVLDAAWDEIDKAHRAALYGSLVHELTPLYDRIKYGTLAEKDIPASLERLLDQLGLSGDKTRRADSVRRLLIRRHQMLDRRRDPRTKEDIKEGVITLVVKSVAALAGVSPRTVRTWANVDPADREQRILQGPEPNPFELADTLTRLRTPVTSRYLDPDRAHPSRIGDPFLDAEEVTERVLRRTQMPLLTGMTIRGIPEKFTGEERVS